MHVLVVTTVHVPSDARILHRQVRSLLDAGHRVTYAAAWTARDVHPPDDLHALDLPPAHGRHRVRALHAARQLLRSPPLSVDLVVLHDPELLLAARSVPAGLPVVWDVHEDLGAALADKAWLPRLARPVVGSAVRRLERQAERRFRLVLAEDAYVQRFQHTHPVVPNLPWQRPYKPGPVEPRAIYVGRLSRARGALDLVEAGRLLRRHGVGLDLVGTADADVHPPLDAAHAAGDVRWHGFLPNPEALRLLDGALAGLSLLHDVPNYRHSMPTKVLEYMERGVPVVTTPLPLARDVVQRHGCGEVVAFQRPAAAADAVLRLHDDRRRQAVLAAAARQAAITHHTWDAVAGDFVRQLEDWAAQRHSR